MEGTITIDIEQLEGLLKDKEYAKEWKADKYFELIKENIRLERENEKLRRQQEYWDKEYVKQCDKADNYRDKYIKWKKKTKELRGQGGQKMKKNKEEKKCFNCNKSGHIARNCRKIERNDEKVKKCYTCGKGSHEQKECYKNQICEKCNRKGHTERICRSKKLERKEE